MRENFNLFTIQGIKNFFGSGGFKNNWATEWVLDDTFGRFICNRSGHSKRTFNAGSGGRDVWCERCTRPLYTKEWDENKQCYKEKSQSEYISLNLK